MMRFVRAIACAIALAVVVVAAGPVGAHEARPAFLSLEQQGDSLWRVTWKRPMRGDLVLQLAPVLPASCVTVGESVSLRQDSALVEISTVRCAAGLDNAVLEIRGLEATLTNALVRIVRTSGQVQIAHLNPSQAAMTIEPTAGVRELAWAYTVLGVEHIIFGYDHLLFVALLVLISATPRRILLAVTGFTVAHSLTLALATFGLIVVPVPLIEAMIALSIVALAAEIALGDRNSIAWRAPILVSSAFGLLHGLGFASALRETGIPQHEIPLSLLFFNVGVELGQLAFVGVLMLAFVFWRRWAAKTGSWVLAAPSPGPGITYGLIYPIGALAGFWTIERAISFF